MLAVAQVNYRETITRPASFNYLHKKQSGGSGQYARVIGRVEPLDDPTKPSEFHNHLIGNAIPPEFVAACEKGMWDAMEKGPLAGFPMQGMKVSSLCHIYSLCLSSDI